MPGGAPTKYRKDFHPKDFIRLSKKGMTLTEIALEWDVDRDSIYEWGRRHKEFSVAIKTGRSFAEAAWTKLGRQAMMGPIEDKATGKKYNVNLGYYVWLSKNLFKWSDRVEEKQEVQQEVKDTTYKAEWGGTKEVDKP